jgi:hypothetical protein
MCVCVYVYVYALVCVYVCVCFRAMYFVQAQYHALFSNVAVLEKFHVSFSADLKAKPIHEVRVYESISSFLRSCAV